MKWKFNSKIIWLFLFIAFATGTSVPKTSASTIDDLKSKISERNQNIADLEKEIAQYEAEVVDTQKQASSLQNTLKQLDLNRKKLLSDIAVTQNKIGNTTDAIEQLRLEIGGKETLIIANQDAIGESLRQMNEQDSRTIVENILARETISDYWNDVENIKTLEIAIRTDTAELQTLKTGLEDKKSETEQKKKELQALNGKLNDQKAIVEQNTKEKNKLLADTKNKEASYTKTLTQKKALRTQFEAELNQFETQLRFQIDPASLPRTGSGVLSWPLSKVKITQQFGDTEFSRAHPLLYSGKGHNGIDLGASQGTPILAAGSGTVEGTGDTDATCPGASYGKWVFIRHPNGLSTLYAHLSLIKAVAGQSVSTGEVIGYSGATGYATGPHLHFTVYASQGVKILDRKSAVCGGTYRMPIAGIQAYLNPLLYL